MTTKLNPSIFIRIFYYIDCINILHNTYANRSQVHDDRSVTTNHAQEQIVTITNSHDECQVMAISGATQTGELLPPDNLQGKTVLLS